MAYGDKVYINIDDLLNNMAYPVEVPEYSVKKTNTFDNGELQQISIPDKHNVVMSRITISSMIDLVDRVVPFKILLADDIIEIYRYLNEYIDLLEQYNDVDEAVAYLAKARNFSTTLKHSVDILVRRGNARAKDLTFTRNIASIFAAAVKSNS